MTNIDKTPSSIAKKIGGIRPWKENENVGTETIFIHFIPKEDQRRLCMDSFGKVRRKLHINVILADHLFIRAFYFFRPRKRRALSIVLNR